MPLTLSQGGSLAHGLGEKSVAATLGTSASLLFSSGDVGFLGVLNCALTMRGAKPGGSADRGGGGEALHAHGWDCAIRKGRTSPESRDRARWCPLRMTSTFSCDIAYSDSPAASRASLGSR